MDTFLNKGNKKHKLTKIEVDELLVMIEEESPYDIAARFNIDRRTVHRYAKKYNIPTRRSLKMKGDIGESPRKLKKQIICPHAHWCKRCGDCGKILGSETQTNVNEYCHTRHTTRKDKIDNMFGCIEFNGFQLPQELQDELRVMIMEMP